MSNKLLILDKDGTLVRPASGNQFVQKPEDQVLLPGVQEAVAHYRSQGFTCVIASNQGGVAQGHKSLNDTILEMEYCLKLLPQIHAAYFCAYEGNFCHVVRLGHLTAELGIDDFLSQRPQLEKFRGMNHQILAGSGFFRKPGPGMLCFAMNFFKVDYALMVGDRDDDEMAASNAGIEFKWADQWRISQK